MRAGTNRLGKLGAMGLLVGLLLCLMPTSAHARPLASFDLNVVGMELDVGPATQQVPKGERKVPDTLRALRG